MIIYAAWKTSLSPSAYRITPARPSFIPVIRRREIDGNKIVHFLGSSRITRKEMRR